MGVGFGHFLILSQSMLSAVGLRPESRSQTRALCLELSPPPLLSSTLCDTDAVDVCSRGQEILPGSPCRNKGSFPGCSVGYGQQPSALLGSFLG